MDRFVKAIYKVSQTQAGAGNSKAKCGKYDEAYLALGFTHLVYTGRYSWVLLYFVAAQRNDMLVSSDRVFKCCW